MGLSEDKICAKYWISKKELRALIEKTKRGYKWPPTN